MTQFRTIYCCGCQCDVDARLTSGSEIYPHRSDLMTRRFWVCTRCHNYVGCHKNRKDNTPLGVIPTPELRRARNHIHAIIDPLWMDGHIDRSRLYSLIAIDLGITEYHTAEIRTIEEARRVWKTVKNLVY